MAPTTTNTTPTTNIAITMELNALQFPERESVRPEVFFIKLLT
jgi:hypothetical protein